MSVKQMAADHVCIIQEHGLLYTLPSLKATYKGTQEKMQLECWLAFNISDKESDAFLFVFLVHCWLVVCIPV